MSSPQQPQNTNKNFGYALSIGMQLGFMIALPLIICMVAGIFIDKKLGTFPIFLILSVFIGMALTIISIYKSVLPFLEKKGRFK
jgi:F0F1-type ATP synthase assembly protein I